MNKSIKNLLILLFCGLMACSEKTSEVGDPPQVIKQEALDFNALSLTDMSAFKPAAKNWQIVGNAYVDQSKERTFVSTEGTGILLNTPNKMTRDNLFTSFEHGDIEMELDVMMPIQSNSGLYFQGRYEVQLLDSWGVKKPQHSDIGGIYQRWDDSREKKGYEGYAPKVNAAKAPGLWQHFKIKFHAPKFDAAGNKVKNAWFEEVWLNGVLLHENQEVSGPTRSGAFEDEKPMGPLMIQGDHAAVAIRNIKYKSYGDQRVTFSDMKMREYKNERTFIPNLDSMELEREINVDSISSLLASGNNPQKLLVFNGKMGIPATGKYLFKSLLDRAGACLIIKGDTILNSDGDFSRQREGRDAIQLEKGDVPFTFIYNKFRSNSRGLALLVEGPSIQQYDLAAPGSWPKRNNNSESVTIALDEETVLQRGFFNHGDRKRTHVISVGSPQDVHYAFDLSFGSLLQVWGGGFLDVTKMWVGRGGEQLSVPVGIAVSSHGDPDFAFLEDENTVWPDTVSANGDYRQVGYKLDKGGNPTFSTKIGDSKVTNKFIPSDKLRRLDRVITTDTKEAIWHKIGEGSMIEKLSENIYAIDDKSYFVDFSGNGELKPVIRQSDGKDELLVQIPAGSNKITYQLTW
jgi:hypothetical protein